MNLIQHFMKKQTKVFGGKLFNMYNVELSEIEICRLGSLVMQELFSSQEALEQTTNESDKKAISQVVKNYKDLFNKLYNVVSR